MPVDRYQLIAKKDDTLRLHAAAGRSIRRSIRRSSSSARTARKSPATTTCRAAPMRLSISRRRRTASTTSSLAMFPARRLRGPAPIAWRSRTRRRSPTSRCRLPIGLDLPLGGKAPTGRKSHSPRKLEAADRAAAGRFARRSGPCRGCDDSGGQERPESGAHRIRPGGRVGVAGDGRRHGDGRWPHDRAPLAADPDRDDAQDPLPGGVGRARRRPARESRHDLSGRRRHLAAGRLHRPGHAADGRGPAAAAARDAVRSRWSCRRKRRRPSFRSSCRSGSKRA